MEPATTPMVAILLLFLFNLPEPVLPLVAPATGRAHRAVLWHKLQGPEKQVNVNKFWVGIRPPRPPQ